MMGFRRFSFRGLEQVKGEWTLVCLPPPPPSAVQTARTCCADHRSAVRGIVVVLLSPIIR